MSHEEASSPETGALLTTPPAAVPLGRTGKRRIDLPLWVGLLLGNRLALAGIVILLIVVLAAIFAPLLTPYDPGAMVADPSQPPSADHWFGTDHQGQDVFAQTLYGARLSLSVGLGAGLLTTLVAVLVGMTAGYVGGWLDDALGMVMNVFLVVPALPLLVVLAAYVPVKGVASMIFVITLVSWPWGARVLRSQTLSMRTRDFVQAALVCGESTGRIVFGEILPSMTSLVVSSFIGAFVAALLTESGLEFLGFGDVNNVSWGTTLYWAQNNAVLLTGEWWHFLFPGLALAITVTACTFVNYGIDAIGNPQLRPIRTPGHRTRPSAVPSPAGQ